MNRFKERMITAVEPFRFAMFLDIVSMDAVDALRLSCLNLKIAIGGSRSMPPAAEDRQATGLTSSEMQYAWCFRQYRLEQPILAAMSDLGWSIRRCHQELVAMLDALVAIDPERHESFKIVDVAGSVHAIEASFFDKAVEAAKGQLARIPASNPSGELFRYGLYLGLKAASNSGDFDDLAMQDAIAEMKTALVDELGAKEPLVRENFRSASAMSTSV